jgi:hypothetical protein
LEFKRPIQLKHRHDALSRLIQGMAKGSPLGFRAESTREIEDNASHQNDADCGNTEHTASNVKSPRHEQNSQKQQKGRYFHGLTYQCLFPERA